MIYIGRFFVSSGLLFVCLGSTVIILSVIFFLMERPPPRFPPLFSSAASDVYKDLKSECLHHFRLYV